MKRKFLIPYAAATLAMAAAICTAGIPSIALARTYEGYNGMKRSSTAEETFQEIKVPAFASIKEVTAEEARSVADGIIVLHFLPALIAEPDAGTYRDRKEEERPSTIAKLITTATSMNLMRL